jgi:hypothetical protein
MHDVIGVQVSQPLAHIPEILLSLLLGKRPRFYLLVQSAVLRIFQHHVGDLSFRVDVHIDQLYNFGVGQRPVHHNLVFSDLVHLI